MAAVAYTEGLKQEFFFLERTPQALLASGLGLLQKIKNSLFETLRIYYLFFCKPFTTATFFIRPLTNFSNHETTVKSTNPPLIWGAI